ncbi:putative membrane protein [Pullulanibacillus pueri]|uniref:Membrane protein n=1 Tax=Pullulanibacillus pueri TaxID=1437324 RepID=A0A8J3A0E2_9BACL|nr:DUF2243 domain-containing protein [Pullulanibacillus pueri]MBM7684177.1 putative membrane protein [Pullulanibacillus pueri]GGH88811.1 membrane protein [Pullulanibacillus pueri]
MVRENNNLDRSFPSDYKNYNLWSGFLFGLGLVAFIDETLFHQLLHWHHFYDKRTLDIGLVADGLFHAFSWFATIGGLFLLADLKRKKSFWLKRWWGGVTLGGGGFQLYDGIIQHKLMRIHQIRYVENVIFYDWVWNTIASVMIIIGLVLVIRTRKESQQFRGDPSNA